MGERDRPERKDGQLPNCHGSRTWLDSGSERTCCNLRLATCDLRLQDRYQSKVGAVEVRQCIKTRYGTTDTNNLGINLRRPDASPWISDIRVHSHPEAGNGHRQARQAGTGSQLRKAGKQAGRQAWTGDGATQGRCQG